VSVRDGLRIAAEGLLAPRVVNSAVAAGIAWLVVQPWGGAADRYAYYAPLGAVMAVSGTLVRTVRSAVQALAAIVLGAVLGVGALHLPIPDVAGVVLLVALGSWLGGLEQFGGTGSWMAWSGIFILIVGQRDPLAYGTAYAGLTALGALIGISLNALIPPLPLGSSGAAVDRLRASLADQFDDLADGLDTDELPTPEDWERRRYDLEPLAMSMQQSLAEAGEARRINWRARRWRHRWDQQHRRGVALHEMYFLVAHLRDVLMTDENASRERLALGGELRPPTAALLRCVAVLLRTSPEDDDAVGRARADAERSLAALVEELRRQRQTSADDLFTAGAVVTVLRRAITTLTGGPEPLESAGA